MINFEKNENKYNLEEMILEQYENMITREKE